MPRKAIVVLFALALVACSSGKKTPQAKSSPPPPPRSSLTGLIVSDANVLKRAALAIKIENSVQARPQSGLGDADVVYEELAEGGITRFIALYQSKTCGNVGPVRSARLVDPNILLPYHAWMAYSGAHPLVQAALKRSGLPLIEYNDYPKAFRRSSARPAPHNLYSTCDQLWKIAKGSAPPANLFSFDEQPPLLPSPSTSGSPGASPSPSAVSKGTHCQIDFSESQTSIWRFNPAKDAYLRSQGSHPHLLADGTQVSARNVLLLYVKVKPGGYLDPAGNPAYEVVVTGTGKASLFRNGLKVSGTWSHPDAKSLFSYTDSTGKAMQLAPGVTWIELVPEGSAVTSG
jgi:DUF3048 family protein